MNDDGQYNNYYTDFKPLSWRPKNYWLAALACAISSLISVYAFYELCVGIAWAYHAVAGCLA